MDELNQTPNTTTLAESGKKTFEEGIKEVGQNAFALAPMFAAVGIAIWWIFSGMVSVTKVQLGITEQIGLAIATVFIALTYCKLIAEGGFQSAKQTKTYQAVSSEWTKAINRGNAHKKEINMYAKEIAKDNLKELRIENCEKNGIDYGEIFDANGNVIKLDYKENKYHKELNPHGYTKKQIRIIKKCIETKIDIPEMFGNISSRWFGIKKRQTQKEYERKTDISNGITRIIIALFSAGITFTWIGFSVQAIIYSLFQIVLWTASGILQRLKNYNFVLNNTMPQIVENTMMINGYMDLTDEKKEIYKKLVIEDDEKKMRLKLPMR